MNENKRIRKAMGKDMGTTGWALLAYYGILNLAVILADCAWGYVFAVAIGGIGLVLWQKGTFCFGTIWKKERQMKAESFLALLAIFISGQALFQVMTQLLQWLFGLIGISLVESVNGASSGTDSLGMFVYVCLLAPIWEEILFRGYVMRALERYGKKFAILASAFLFGMFHGNVVQTPYAFCVGLIMGYVAMEYSMVWSVVLHMINNLVLGDLIGRLVEGLPAVAQEAVFAALIWGCALIAIVILICKRREILTYLRRERFQPMTIRSFFTSPGVLAMTAFAVANMLVMILL